MNEQYDKAKELFLKICDLKPHEQEALLDEECAEDPQLRVEVESLLAHNDIPTASIAFGAKLTHTSAPDVVPKRTRIGSYRVIHELGQGGMGVVYLCVRDDDQIKHRVAIKLVKRGMDTEQVLQRFEMERQLLASMNHPGIARLFDAGQTEDGLPFLVMEYVEGQPIDEYCDTRRLSIAERLELFRKVCAAVHYAHQNLIVHRDLKPSNIMVSADGEPKLLDFGIAKLLNPELSLIKADPTVPGFRVMTPEYASPEQVRGYPLTTGSDVYSLGVLLYELMSGHRPYHLRSRVRAEIEHAICEEDPERPSTSISRIESTHDNDDSGTTSTITPESVSKDRESRPDRLRKRLAGDIDNIVLMAMRKEPQRRYSSAEQLADDISRHLNGLPVISRGDGLGYRLNKFVRRHRAGVAAAIVIALSLLGGIVATSWQAQIAATQRDIAQDAQLAEAQQRALAEVERDRAETQREKAQRRFDQVRALAHTFMFDFHDAIVQLDGSIPARQLLVTTALEYLDNLAQDAGDDKDLNHELASAYDRVGQIRKSIRNPSLDDIPGALENYRKGLDIRQTLLSASPENQELGREVSTSHIYIGDMLMLSGASAEASAEYRKAMHISETLVKLDPKWRRNYSIALFMLGKALLREGKLNEAKQNYLKSLTIREELVAESPEDPTLLRSLSVGYNSVGGRLAADGDNQGALDRYMQSLKVREHLLKLAPDNGRAKRDLANSHLFVANAYLALGNTKAATDHGQQCIELAKQRAKDNPNSARAKFGLALGYYLLGRIDYQAGNWEHAHNSFMELKSMIGELSVSSPDNTQYSQYLAVSHQSLGEVDVAMDDPNGAINEYRKALAIVESLVAKDPADIRWSVQRAQTQLKLGSALIRADEVDKAQIKLLAAQETYAALLETQAQDADIRDGLASTLQQLSILSATQDKGSDALKYAQEALATASEQTPALLRDLAIASFITGNRDDAIKSAKLALVLLDDDLKSAEAVELRKTLELDLKRYRSNESD